MNTTTETKPDVLVNDQGSIVVFQPMTACASDWIDCMVHSEPHNWLDDGLYVEHRFADVIIDGMLNDGLIVEPE